MEKDVFFFFFKRSKVFKDDDSWLFCFIFGADGKSEVEQMWAIDATVESGCSSAISIEREVRLRRQGPQVPLCFRNTHKKLREHVSGAG